MALEEKTQEKKRSAVHPYSSCFLCYFSVLRMFDHLELFSFIYIYVYIFHPPWPHCTACGILVPHQGWNPHHLHWEPSLNHNHQGSPWNALQWFCPVPNTQSHKYWRVLSMFPSAINRLGLVLILLGRSLDLTLCNLISLKAIVCLQCPQATSGLIFHSCT